MIYSLILCLFLFAGILTFDLSCMECCDGDPPCCEGDPPDSFFAHGFEGITNGTCSECLDYNSGPIELVKVPGECRWEATGFGGCGPAPWLEVHADGSATLAIGGATYTIAEFDCDGNNTFTLDSAGTECEDWPPEIDINLGPEDGCGACEAGAPSQVRVSGLEGFTDGDCTGAGNLSLGSVNISPQAEGDPPDPCNYRLVLEDALDCGDSFPDITIDVEFQKDGSGSRVFVEIFQRGGPGASIGLWRVDYGPTDPFSCLGTHNLSLSIPGTVFGNLPEILTVQPA